MPGQLMCRVERDTPVATIRLQGSLDIATATELRRVLLKCLVEHPAAVIIDLAELVVRDDICLTVFPAVAVHAAGTPILLCAASAPVDRALRALAVDRRVTICETHDDAVALTMQVGRLAPLREGFAPTPMSVPQARALAEMACQRWGIAPDATERVRVVVTELMANSVRHAGTPIELWLRCTQNYVHVSVTDHDTRPARLRSPENPDDEGGRGLIIVSGFAQSWGCRPRADGKVTWATVRRRPVGR